MPPIAVTNSSRSCAAASTGSRDTRRKPGRYLSSPRSCRAALEAVAEQVADSGWPVAHAVEQELRQPHPLGAQVDGEGCELRLVEVAAAQHRRGRGLRHRRRVDRAAAFARGEQRRLLARRQDAHGRLRLGLEVLDPAEAAERQPARRLLAQLAQPARGQPGDPGVEPVARTGRARPRGGVRVRPAARSPGTAALRSSSALLQLRAALWIVARSAGSRSRTRISVSIRTGCSLPEDVDQRRLAICLPRGEPALRQRRLREQQRVPQRARAGAWSGCSASSASKVAVRRSLDVARGRGGQRRLEPPAGSASKMRSSWASSPSGRSRAAQQARVLAAGACSSCAGGAPPSANVPRSTTGRARTPTDSRLHAQDLDQALLVGRVRLQPRDLVQRRAPRRTQARAACARSGPGRRTGRATSPAPARTAGGRCAASPSGPCARTKLTKNCFAPSSVGVRERLCSTQQLVEVVAPGHRPQRGLHPARGHVLQPRRAFDVRQHVTA